MISNVLLVEYASAVVQLLLLQLNCICAHAHIHAGVSVADNVNVLLVVFVGVHHQIEIDVDTGHKLSYVVFIVLDAVLLFHAVSIATDHHTLTATAHCALGVIIILYTLVLTVVKLVTVQFVTVTSHVMKFDTASLNVHVTTNDPLT